MNPIEYLRQFHVIGFALFDLVVAFLGMYLLSPLLSKIFLKIRIDIPKISWIYLTLPIGILAHLLTFQSTPMTTDFLDIHGHYTVKIVMVALIILGVKDIQIVGKKSLKTGK